MIPWRKIVYFFLHCKEKREIIVDKKVKKVLSTRMRFELMRAEPNGLAFHRLNHSATLSYIL
jgi:hypothetical protein